MKKAFQDDQKFGTTDFFMLMIVMVWAVNFLFVKIALEEFSPLVFNSIRLGLAAVVLLTMLLITGEGIKVERRDIWKLIVLGIFGNTFYQLFFIIGFNLTTASNTSVILAMTPVFIALLSTVIKHESLNWKAWAGILISFLGLYLVITCRSGSMQFSWNSIRGDLIVFVGVIFWSVYTVFSKPFLERISPIKWTSLTMAFGALFFFLFSIRDLRDFDPGSISLKSWVMLVFSGVFALSIAYIVWLSSVKRIGSSKTAIYGNLVPVFTIVFAYFFLSEKISFLQVVGVFIIMIGVYLARMGYNRFYKK